MSDAIIGREDELDRSRRSSAGSRRDRALLLSGEAGIGKTILWERASARPRRIGRVLVGRGSEAEASLSFAGLSELLAGLRGGGPRSRRHAGGRWRSHCSLPSRARQRSTSTRSGSLSWTCCARWPSGARCSSRWTTCSGSTRPRRGRSRSLFGGFVTSRSAFCNSQTGSGAREPGRSRASLATDQLTLGPLSLAAVRRLLEERLGLELTRPELVRVQEATAGNPFFALELGRELVRTNTRPAPGQALRVPESLHELLGSRLARLPGETLDVLLLVAALARPTVELLTSTYGERDRVLEALEAAAQEAVVELDDSRALHTSLARVDLLRARAGLEAARRARGAGGCSVGRRGAGPPPRARRRRARRIVAEELERPPSRQQVAAPRRRGPSCTSWPRS